MSTYAGRVQSTERQQLARAVVAWFVTQGRDLPWRRPGTSAWAVLVSEFMLQQTPVSRVLEPWAQWTHRWPTPGDLAAEPAASAVAAWGRLGYPRRAQRLHAAAITISLQHQGQVPDDAEALRALPGVGDYTAAAVASFAFGQAHVVLDTNVRRVLARIGTAREFPTNSPTRAEYSAAAEFLPRGSWSADLAVPAGAGTIPAAHPTPAALWAAAVMELGALVCTARNPGCRACPVAGHCRWLAQGRPAHDGPPRKAQPWAGTDRQCRGVLLDLVRRSDRVPVGVLLGHWHDPEQSRRCFESLLADRLLVTDGQTVTL